MKSKKVWPCLHAPTPLVTPLQLTKEAVKLTLGYELSQWSNTNPSSVNQLIAMIGFQAPDHPEAQDTEPLYYNVPITPAPSIETQVLPVEGITEIESQSEVSPLLLVTLILIVVAFKERMKRLIVASNESCWFWTIVAHIIIFMHKPIIMNYVAYTYVRAYIHSMYT